MRSIASVMLGAVLAVGCAGAPRHALVERIGGVDRVRPSFASATAYEAYLRAEVLAARHDYATAARQLELAELADATDGYLPARRAEILLAAGHPDDALRVATDATERLPRSAAAWLALGEARVARRDATGAARAFARALAEAPDDPEVRGAVSRAQGGTAAQQADAIENAPDARAGDRTVAQRLLLDPLRDDRPTLRTARRALARAAWDRRAYREVDAILTPIVTGDAGDVSDRVRLIEARAYDGRPGDAARLVASLPVRAQGGVAPAERARLWLLAARPEIASEEAQRAFDASSDDVLARTVLGEALLATGHTARGLALLAAVPAGSTYYVRARIAAAGALAVAGRDALGDAVLERAIASESDDPVARDRLRIARATRMLERGAAGEARAALAVVETSMGRQRRGEMLAGSADPATVLPDLRTRSGDAADDAVADAWIALVCAQHASACATGERERALAFARAHATEAPETLRAMAASASDRRVAIELLRRASERDPLSPWNGVLSRALGATGRPRGQ